jgi:hypothetical protein
MPKVLLYITRKITWIFLFWDTDFNENRAHVHVGKKSTEELCKIWLEPEVSVAKSGDLKDKELRQVVEIAKEYHSKLLAQWKVFKKGKPIKIISINK